jgi:hypothetical protein
MVHKLRLAMGKRDEQYTLSGELELDEGFFLPKPMRIKKINP